ncbi:hypothetical protein IHE44_0009013 [Lamprotornis superbus]|uniref:BZIP domain-containing protein n=1 Tax=Lamprotornis superbus TaxID=245042 RepID=A0A835NXU3_9PASS|nr:hypothetical protein IHE44_0009013 [Lamprotornis superbus]
MRYTSPDFVLAKSSVCTLQTCEVFLAGVFQSHEEDDRKVRRREKNRVAAQRSRKKQTQKADKLHEAWACLHTNPAHRAVGVRHRKEYESLEQENTSLKREIGKLTDEMKHLSEGYIGTVLERKLHNHAEFSVLWLWQDRCVAIPVLLKLVFALMAIPLLVFEMMLLCVL